MAYCCDCVIYTICPDAVSNVKCDGYISKKRLFERCIDCTYLERLNCICKLTDEKVSIYYSGCEKFKRR